MSICDYLVKFRVQLDRMDNLNPKLHKKADDRVVKLSDYDESMVDEIDSREVFGKNIISPLVIFFCAFKY